MSSSVALSSGHSIIRGNFDLTAHEAAFALGYVHGDISPGNILIHTTIDDGEEVRKGLLADWELCKRLEDYSEGRRQPDRTVSDSLSFNTTLF